MVSAPGVPAVAIAFSCARVSVVPSANWTISTSAPLAYCGTSMTIDLPVGRMLITKSPGDEGSTQTEMSACVRSERTSVFWSPSDPPPSLIVSLPDAEE